MDFLQEFRRRRLIQTAALYIAVAWGGTEILTFLVSALWGGRPAAVFSKYLAILFVAGFPVAMYLAWTRDLGRKARRFASAAAMAVVLVATLVWIVPGERVDEDRSPAGDATIRSLAVLPLENLSAEPGQDNFAAGMTEALIAELSQLGAFKVISRTSVMQYAGTTMSIPEIARELDVDAIVEGSVLRSDDAVRITAQLVAARSDHHLWADSFEGKLEDVFALQRETAQDIARGIDATVTSSTIADRQPVRVDPAALDAYIEARMAGFDAHGDAQDVIRAAEKVIELDPEFAPGYAFLSDLYGYLALTTNVTHGDAYLRASRFARKAIELDPHLPYARIAMGRLHYQFEWDWEAAEREFRLGLELDPNNIDGLILYGSFRVLIFRDCDDGLAILEQARSRDPFNPGTHFNLGVYSFHCRRYAESIRHLEKAIELAPDFRRARLIMSWDHEFTGRNDLATEICRALLDEADGEFETMLYMSCAWVFYTGGQPADARVLHDRLENPPAGVTVDPIYLAWVCLAVDDTGCALDWLEESLRVRSSNLIFLQTAPAFDPIRDEPRFLAILRAMAFPNRQSDSTS